MKKTRILTHGAIIATIYVILTYIVNAVGLANGVVQIRLSEALCILPMFTFAAVPGLFVGCILSNILTGAILHDIVFGSIATLLGALGTYYLGKNKYIASIFPIASNTIIIPLVLKYAYGMEQSYAFMVLTVFIGELISCGIFGVLLHDIVKKSKIFK